MKQIFAVKDLATDAYGTPFFMATPGEALRSFKDEVNSGNPNSAIAKHPEDYILYHIGDYDDDKGEIVGTENQQIARAKDLVQPKQEA